VADLDNYERTVQHQITKGMTMGAVK
jgi:hypothetical protein